MKNHNFDSYELIHTEIMRRLKNEEITVEKAKEVIDLAFRKYIIEKCHSCNNTLHYHSHHNDKLIHK